MSNANEKRMNTLLTFPVGSYLMLRLDYVLICQDELEAKILRLIEMHIDSERDRLYREYLNTLPKGTEPPERIEITKEVWVAISHRAFLYDLYGLVKSETTLKRAIKSLLKKKFIRMHHEPSKQYDAPEYQMATEVIQAEFDKLAKLGIAGYQKLRGSNSDTLKHSGYQNLTPSEGQKLIPSEGEGRGSIFDTNSRNITKKNSTEEECVSEDTTLPPDTHTPAFEQKTESSLSVVTSVESSLSPQQATPSTTAVASLPSLTEEGQSLTSLVQHTEVTQASTSNPPARGLPTDHNRVGSPPADDKSATNKPPPLSRQELALRRKWAKYVSEDITKETVLNALALRAAWLASYGPYGDAEWDNQALLWIAQQNGTWESVAKVYSLWEDKEPEKPIHPEMVKNKWFWLSEKTAKNRSSPSQATSNGHRRAVSPTAGYSAAVSPEISQRNLERLKARVAAKQAAEAAATAGKEA